MAGRRKLSLVLVTGGGLLILLAIAALALGRHGASDQGSGRLAWTGRPQVFIPPRLPHDRVLTARVRNDSLRQIRLSAADLRLTDASGRTVDAAAVFLDSFMHGLYPPTRQPQQISKRELVRTGRLAVLRPGASVPLTVAWRRGGGAGVPLRLDYGAGSLPMPRE
jgi:hypothetical protein